MKTRVMRSILTTVVLTLLLVSKAVAQTDEPSEEESADGWQFRLAPLYIWFAGIEGDATLGPVTAPVEITFSDALENLDAIFTLAFEARKRRWSLFTNGFHLQLKPESTLPDGTRVGVTIKNDIVELGGSYRVLDEDVAVDLLAGARYTNLKVSGNALPLTFVSESWWDGFGGARVVYAFGEKKNWTITGRADAGAGGSDFTWSAAALLDWRFANWVSVTGGYKWLGYDYSTGSGLSRFDWKVTYQGPIAGVVFRF